ncbi:hypothetical protein GCM10010174_09380 [Kutzneria viridogrisea]|uniref:Protein RecA n=2 Tax=Kutzneria TaxID=43356 RepID=W5WKQ9_9PSEU|nr:hypothetical protein KALB_8100 [Kutzneria albida DSM 43870]MBA8931422.1 hypothetical protein [Kutzneria viridogrisea]
MPRSATASLAALNGVSRLSELTRTPADQTVGRVLPVLDGLADLLPWGGLRRGSTVVVRGSTTLLLALLAAATVNGSWAAVVGVPDLGLLAAAELGVVVHRLALVPQPGEQLLAVTGALLDGFDLVAVRQAGELREADARRLSARARNRGAVLVPFGQWPGADLELDCTGRWSGLGEGHGYLRQREVVVRSRGRGAAARGNQVRLVLPGQDGIALPVPTQAELRRVLP